MKVCSAALEIFVFSVLGGGGHSESQISMFQLLL
jgi:hypothetical protein